MIDYDQIRELIIDNISRTDRISINVKYYMCKFLCNDLIQSIQCILILGTFLLYLTMPLSISSNTEYTSFIGLMIDYLVKLYILVIYKRIFENTLSNINNQLLCYWSLDLLNTIFSIWYVVYDFWSIDSSICIIFTLVFILVMSYSILVSTIIISLSINYLEHIQLDNNYIVEEYLTNIHDTTLELLLLQSNNDVNIIRRRLRINNNYEKNIFSTYLTSIMIPWNSNITNQSSCTICLEDFNINEMVVKLECVHYYHKQCILDWGDINIYCPVCRNDMMPLINDNIV